jgi:hypothetical protein
MIVSFPYAPCIGDVRVNDEQLTVAPVTMSTALRTIFDVAVPTDPSSITVVWSDSVILHQVAVFVAMAVPDVMGFAVATRPTAAGKAVAPKRRDTINTFVPSDVSGVAGCPPPVLS